MSSRVSSHPHCHALRFTNTIRSHRSCACIICSALSRSISREDLDICHSESFHIALVEIVVREHVREHASRLASCFTRTLPTPYSWAPVLVQVLQTLQVVSSSRCCTRPLIPWAPILVQVLQTLQVVTSSRRSTRPLIPWTPVLVQVFQTFQVATSSRFSTRTLIPWATVLVQVLQTLQVAP